METSGAGLGLYIVRQLVDALHGSISLDSQPSTGTTVTVTLPYLDAATLSSKIAFG
jgi:signal transduction histidine kinase